MEKEYTVGEMFQLRGKTFQVCPPIKAGSCEGCDGKKYDKSLCTMLPSCYSDIRGDAMDVVFKIID